MARPSELWTAMSSSRNSKPSSQYDSTPKTKRSKHCATCGPSRTSRWTNTPPSRTRRSPLNLKSPPKPPPARSHRPQSSQSHSEVAPKVWEARLSPIGAGGSANFAGASLRGGGTFHSTVADFPTDQAQPRRKSSPTAGLLVQALTSWPSVVRKTRPLP